MEYLYFNQQDSVEHFDLTIDPESYMSSGETFFHAYSNGNFLMRLI